MTKPISAFYLYYDRSLLLFSRPMRDEDTSAFREIFQYSSWLWPSSRPNQILLILMDYYTWQFLVSLRMLFITVNLWIPSVFWFANAKINVNVIIAITCVCRVAELGSLSSGAKMAMEIFVKRVFTIFASNASIFFGFLA